jgi:hypothetical protein
MAPEARQEAFQGRQPSRLRMPSDSRSITKNANAAKIGRRGNNPVTPLWLDGGNKRRFSRPLPMTTSKRWLQEPVPVDFRTVVFCLLAGISIGLPISVLDLCELDARWHGPQAVKTAVLATCLGALILLPIWSVVFLRSRRLVMLLGLWVFFLVFIAGLSMPEF